MKRTIISLILLITVLNLTACSLTTNNIDPNTPTDATTTDAQKNDTTYSSDDNSIDALMSRAITAVDSKYLVSHWGNSKCHIVIGGKQNIDSKDQYTIINEEDLVLDRLIDCEIGADNVCSSCGYHYSKEEFDSFLSKSELIAAEIAAQTPEEPEIENFGFNGKAPYVINENFMFSLDMSKFNVDKNIISCDDFTLTIEEKDSVCKDVSYFKDESNLGELMTDTGYDDYVAICKFTDDTQSTVENVYIIKNYDKSSIMFKFSNMKPEKINDSSSAMISALGYVLEIDYECNEEEITIEDFYTTLAESNSNLGMFWIQDPYGYVRFTYDMIPDLSHKIILDECKEAYIDTLKDSEINRGYNYIVSNYLIDDIEANEQFIEQELSEPNEQFKVYKNGDYYYFKSINENISENKSFNLIGIAATDADNALMLYNLLLDEEPN